MQVTTLSFGNMHNQVELFSNMFRARHETFIQHNKWDLPEADGMEYDQYDTPASRWIAVHEFGHVLAGVRLTPTTARCGIYSYMIRDAQRGLLDSIPSDLLSTRRHRSQRTSGNPRASSSRTGSRRTSGCGSSSTSSARCAEQRAICAPPRSSGSFPRTDRGGDGAWGSTSTWRGLRLSSATARRRAAASASTSPERCTDPDGGAGACRRPRGTAACGFCLCRTGHRLRA
jgi:hypothetical protein